MNRTAADMLPGESATISSTNVEELPLRVVELGCVPGHRIEALRIAPLGDPILFQIDGNQIAIRKESAQFITILND